VAAASWSTWQALRDHQRLTHGEARRVLRFTLESLLRSG
jgi:hypothetical protein